MNEASTSTPWEPCESCGVAVQAETVRMVVGVRADGSSGITRPNRHVFTEVWSTNGRVPARTAEHTPARCRMFRGMAAAGETAL